MEENRLEDLSVGDQNNEYISTEQANINSISSGKSEMDPVLTDCESTVRKRYISGHNVETLENSSATEKSFEEQKSEMRINDVSGSDGSTCEYKDSHKSTGITRQTDSRQHESAADENICDSSSGPTSGTNLIITLGYPGRLP